ncbi:hypothetical protein C0J52_05009 [Blattella germanica]|nr:hypothetical protein C0J52_05009 [Blattella germanica]
MMFYRSFENGQSLMAKFTKSDWTNKWQSYLIQAHLVDQRCDPYVTDSYRFALMKFAGNSNAVPVKSWGLSVCLMYVKARAGSGKKIEKKRKDDDTQRRLISGKGNILICKEEIDEGVIFWLWNNKFCKAYAKAIRLCARSDGETCCIKKAVTSRVEDEVKLRYNSVKNGLFYMRHPLERRLVSVDTDAALYANCQGKSISLEAYVTPNSAFHIDPPLRREKYLVLLAIHVSCRTVKEIAYVKDDYPTAYANKQNGSHPLSNKDFTVLRKSNNM